MLFVLTGDIQTGKTRWLEHIVEDLQRNGVAPYGVIAPGVWADRRSNPGAFPHADANGFEKLGIDNVLLPEGERITFALRTDVAENAGSFDSESQSARASLGWHISDEAIQQVNGHFARLAARIASESAPGFVVVDELGRLELERGGGLVEALSLLEKGPYPACAHALVVVRSALLPLVNGRFDRWGETLFARPDDNSRTAILAAALDRR